MLSWSTLSPVSDGMGDIFLEMVNHLAVKPATQTSLAWPSLRR